MYAVINALTSNTYKTQYSNDILKHITLVMPLHASVGTFSQGKKPEKQLKGFFKGHFENNITFLHDSKFSFPRLEFENINLINEAEILA